MEIKIPDCYLCKINNKLLINPFIIDSGFSYEKEDIQKHFKNSGKFCPFTKIKVSSNIVPNTNLKNSIEEFLN